MGNDIHIFKPIRRQLGFWCGFFVLCIFINVHFLLDSGSMILCIPLVLLIGMFIVLFAPLVKNQIIVLNNEDIRVFEFGRINRLVFCEHLKQIVVKGNEVISYQFETNRRYFQISPRAYYDGEELASIFSDLKNKCRGIVSVVEK